MVIKTESCYYTEFKIYPGHGRKFIRKDGRLVSFINQKARSLYEQKIKAQRLTWSQQWRRINKKGKSDSAGRKKTKRAAKLFRGVAGVSVEELQKRRTQKPEIRKATREQSVRDAKDKKKAAAKKDVTKKKITSSQATGFVRVPKLRKQVAKR